MVATTPASRKGKSRIFQQWVRDQLIEKLGIHDLDIESTGMGQPGIDVKLSRAGREKFPYGIECKRVERLDWWQAITQAKTNAKKENLEWCLFVKRNHNDAIVVMNAKTLIQLQQELNEAKKEIETLKVFGSRPVGAR